MKIPLLVMSGGANRYWEFAKQKDLCETEEGGKAFGTWGHGHAVRGNTTAEEMWDKLEQYKNETT